MSLRSSIGTDRSDLDHRCTEFGFPYSRNTQWRIAPPFITENNPETAWRSCGDHVEIMWRLITDVEWNLTAQARIPDLQPEQGLGIVA